MESLFINLFKFKKQVKFKRPSRKCRDCFDANQCEKMIREKMRGARQLDRGSHVLKNIREVQTSCKPRNNQNENERPKGDMRVVAKGQRINQAGKAKPAEAVIFSNVIIYNCSEYSIVNKF